MPADIFDIKERQGEKVLLSYHGHLQTVEIPPDVTVIGMYAFRRCFTMEERLYHFFHETDCEPERLLTLRDLFFSDDHSLWYRHSHTPQEGEPDPEQDASSAAGDQADEQEAVPSPDPDSDENGTRKQADGDGGAVPEGSRSAEESNAFRPSEEDSAALSWKDISGKVQTDLETLSREYGEKAGAILRNLKEVNREHYDYADYLRRFCIPGEVLKTSDEEFDYIYYTYGLSLYDDVPLVEPLEYSEQKRVRDLAIVIDTSASVDGDLVHTFLQKTYNILKSTESFFHTVNIHLIQCDAAVQQDIKITSPQQLEHVFSSLMLKGFGGTDFRPAFAYVDRLLEEKEFSDLMGIIYFTDGDGIYPEEQPEYPAAFVFLEDAFEDRNVPVWAIKVILEKDEV